MMKSCFRMIELSWTKCDRVYEVCYGEQDSSRFDLLAKQKANSFQNRSILLKMCIYCQETFNGIGLYQMSCNHCVCKHCAVLLNEKKCLACLGAIEVKFHALEATDPIPSVGIIAAVLPAGSQEEMLAELQLYQKYFDNTKKETFESLSMDAYLRITENAEAARQSLMERDLQIEKQNILLAEG